MDDRDKISFSELDKRRRENRSGRSANGEGRPGGERRSRAGSAAYKRRVEERLFGRGGDSARLRLADRLRGAHATPNFLRTFREYLKGYGMPDDVALLLLLLDLDDEREVLRVLDALHGVQAAAPPEQRSLLKSRLRNVEMSASSDALADAAGQLLTKL